MQDLVTRSCFSGLLILVIPLALWLLSRYTKRTTAAQTATIQNAGGKNGDDGNSNTGPAQTTQSGRSARRRWTMPAMTVNFDNVTRALPWLVGLPMAYLGWSIGDWADAWGITPLMWARPITWGLTLAGFFIPALIRWAHGGQRSLRPVRARVVPVEIKEIIKGG